MRKITEIIIHCSATAEGIDIDAKTIDRWHRERGFSSIGYHFVVKLDGTIEIGRPLGYIGAHCLGHNANSIGICYIGGIERNTRKSKDTRTEKQKKSLLELLQYLKLKFPSATIHGHREFAKKDCPCFDAREEYKSV